MEVLKWIFVILCLVLDKTYASEGKEFPGDKLIGRKTLIDNANQWGGNYPYRTTLMVVEGSFDNYNLGNGFFMGYQFYDEMYAQAGRINLQLYRLKNHTSSDHFEGYYTLVDESGWITTKGGLNVYYHKHSIIIDTSDSISDSYIIGFTVPKCGGDVPIIFTECSGTSTPALVSTSNTETGLGETILFQRDSYQSCISYSIQGIFLPTNLASTSGGRCSLTIAQLDDPADVTSHTSLPDYIGFPGRSNTFVCRLVRAEYADYDINVKTKMFELPAASDCSNTKTAFVEIGDQKQPSHTDDNIWGRYCGSNIFSSTETDKPYVKITMDTGTSSPGYKGFKFSVELKEKSNHLIWSLARIGLAAVIAVVIISVICITRKKIKKTTNRPQVTPTNENPTGRQIISNINDNSKVSTYPQQLSATSFPPSTNQPVDNYPGGVANNAMARQQQPEHPPPAYSTIYPDHLPECNQYGEPSPAVYKDP